jgi:hypothetical protein
MKIAFIVEKLNPELSEEYSRIYALAERLADHHAVLLVSSGKTTESKLAGKVSLLTIESLISDAGELPLLSSQDMPRLAKILKAFNPDVVHCMSYGFVALYAQDWSIRHAVPFIYETYSDEDDNFKKTWLESFQKSLNDIGENVAEGYYAGFVNKADIVITDFKGELATGLQLGKNKNQILIEENIRYSSSDEQLKRYLEIYEKAEKIEKKRNPLLDRRLLTFGALAAGSITLAGSIFFGRRVWKRISEKSGKAHS